MMMGRQTNPSIVQLFHIKDRFCRKEDAQEIAAVEFYCAQINSNKSLHIHFKI